MGLKWWSNFFKSYNKSNVLGKIGFLGSICSIIGIALFFFPDNDTAKESLEKPHIINGLRNVQVQGNNNIILYENKRSEVVKKKSSFEGAEKEFNFIDYFGLYAGSYWVYNVGGMVQNTQQKYDDVKNSFKVSVLLVDNNQQFSSGIVVLLNEGYNHYTYCKGGRMYYVYNKKHVFDVCDDYDKAKNIYEKIYSNKGYRVTDIKGANLLYKIPFKINEVWLWNEFYTEDDDERVKKNVDWYTYFVSKKIKKMNTPIGEFKNCNEISYNMISSSEQSYVCGGVGLISKVFEHNGTLDIENIQLIDFNINRF